MGSSEKRKIMCGQEGDGGTTERRRGKQQRKSLDNTRNDLSDRVVMEEAQYRVKWRHLIRNVDPTLKWAMMRMKNNN